jgi:hypothetical protein
MASNRPQSGNTGIRYTRKPRKVRSPQEAVDRPHTPRFLYDCGNCKFSWCCGYGCVCALRGMSVVLRETPMEVKRKVFRELVRINWPHRISWRDVSYSWRRNKSQVPSRVGKPPTHG